MDIKKTLGDVINVNNNFNKHIENMITETLCVYNKYTYDDIKNIWNNKCKYREYKLKYCWNVNYCGNIKEYTDINNKNWCKECYEGLYDNNITKMKLGLCDYCKIYIRNKQINECPIKSYYCLNFINHNEIWMFMLYYIQEVNRYKVDTNYKENKILKNRNKRNNKNRKNKYYI